MSHEDKKKITTATTEKKSLKVSIPIKHFNKVKEQRTFHQILPQTEPLDYSMSNLNKKIQPLIIVKRVDPKIKQVAQSPDVTHGNDSNKNKQNDEDLKSLKIIIKRSDCSIIQPPRIMETKDHSLKRKISKVEEEAIADLLSFSNQKTFTPINNMPGSSNQLSELRTIRDSQNISGVKDSKVNSVNALTKNDQDRENYSPITKMPVHTPVSALPERNNNNMAQLIPPSGYDDFAPYDNNNNLPSISHASIQTDLVLMSKEQYDIMKYIIDHNISLENLKFMTEKKTVSKGTQTDEIEETVETAIVKNLTKAITNSLQKLNDEIVILLLDRVDEYDRLPPSNNEDCSESSISAQFDELEYSFNAKSIVVLKALFNDHSTKRRKIIAKAFNKEKKANMQDGTTIYVPNQFNCPNECCKARPNPSLNEPQQPMSSMSSYQTVSSTGNTSTRQSPDSWLLANEINEPNRPVTPQRSEINLPQNGEQVSVLLPHMNSQQQHGPPFLPQNQHPGASDGHSNTSVRYMPYNTNYKKW